jgi:hypothetical protein
MATQAMNTQYYQKESSPKNKTHTTQPRPLKIVSQIQDFEFYIKIVSQQRTIRLERTREALLKKSMDVDI